MNMIRYSFILSLFFCHSLLALNSRDNLLVEDPFSLNEQVGWPDIVNGELGSHDVQGTVDPITVRFTIAGDRVRLREFFEYDEQGALKTHIKDDGSSLQPDNLEHVTERRIQRITNNRVFPVGRLATVEECYLDLKTGKEVLLKIISNIYNKEGHLSFQTHYDSLGQAAYTLRWSYNALGQVISEQDALGQTTRRSYDSNGNLVYEEGPGNKGHRVYGYDLMNRLIREEEISSEGDRLVKTFNYDFKGCRVSSTEIDGSETLYFYDALGRLIQSESSVLGIQQKRYDELGNVIEFIDGEGNRTQAAYTLHGKPYWILYPDGSEEHFEYSLKGKLLKATARNGTFTIYAYDHLGRAISKQVFSPKGELLTCQTRCYNNFHLLSEIDANGHVTSYAYDGAGRLISKEKEGQRTEYLYDTLGRLQEARHIIGGSYLATVQLFDNLDRVIEETVQDHNKVYQRIRYAYDEAGHCIQTTTFGQAGTATESAVYNFHGDPILLEDALGNRTVISYDYSRGVTESTDPSGVMTLITQDAAGNILSVIKKDPFGQVIQSVENQYDYNGNCIRCLEKDPFTTKVIKTLWTYDGMQNRLSQVEAAGTPEQKSKRFAYNSAGQLEIILKPDGLELWHTYDPLGRLSSFAASDGSFKYCYTYDACGQPVEVRELISGTCTRKTFDAQGRLVHEAQANGLSIGYVYDELNRLRSLHLPHGLLVQHTYQGPWLYKVNAGLYSHTYHDYDLSGNPKRSTLIGNAGSVQYRNNLQGQVLQIKSQAWKEEIKARNPQGYLLERTITDLCEARNYHYNYDYLGQLASETQPKTCHYRCDSWNNVIYRNDELWSRNALHQLLANEEGRYSYDPNGNRQTKTTTDTVRYIYDAQDRLVQVLSPHQKAEYTYDESNRRLSKTLYSITDTGCHKIKSERYLYQGQIEIGCYDEEDRLISCRLLGRNDQAVAVEIDNEVYAPVHDHLGHVSALIYASDGSVFETYRYSAFGEEQLFDAEGEQKTHSSNPWRYAGKRKDHETGFIYFGPRFYDPVTYSWITPDPI